jgi:general secretion pathway protein J
MHPPPARSESGFTLVELMVGIAVAAVIALAGFAVLDSVVAARERSEGRLDRLARIQRTMYLLTADLEQLAPGPVVAEGDVFTFRRYTTGGQETSIRYALVDGDLRRTVGGAGAQRLLPDVESVRWTVMSRDGAWTSPPDTASANGERARAVAVDIRLAPDAPPPVGDLRRVVELPAAP